MPYDKYCTVPNIKLVHHTAVAHKTKIWVARKRIMRKIGRVVIAIQ